jgi:hypothetical protein
MKAEERQQEHRLNSDLEIKKNHLIAENPEPSPIHRQGLEPKS